MAMQEADRARKKAVRRAKGPTQPAADVAKPAAMRLPVIGFRMDERVRLVDGTFPLQSEPRGEVRVPLRGRDV